MFLKNTFSGITQNGRVYANANFLKYDYVDMLLRGMMGLPESFHTRHFNFSLFQGPFVFCEFYSEPVRHNAL